VAERGHRKEVLQTKELKDTCKTAKNKSKHDELLAAMKLVVNITGHRQNQILSQLRGTVHKSFQSVRTDSQTGGGQGGRAQLLLQFSDEQKSQRQSKL